MAYFIKPTGEVDWYGINDFGLQSGQNGFVTVVCLVKLECKINLFTKVM